MSLTSKLKSLITARLFHGIRSSYSQSGEDIIICDLFARLGIKQPTYLDIGTNDPVLLNNTYRLYKKGSRGVCVEPNPALVKKIRHKRKRDLVINAGVAFNSETEADYYMFSEKASGLNTFSQEEAKFWETTGNTEIGRHPVEKTIKIQLLSINDIMAKYFSPSPNFISIDVEGLDFEILKTLDFAKYKPEVLCIETLGFKPGNKDMKKRDIPEFLATKGYFAYADSYINTIFCLKTAAPNLAQ